MKNNLDLDNNVSTNGIYKTYADSHLKGRSFRDCNNGYWFVAIHTHSGNIVLYHRNEPNSRIHTDIEGLNRQILDGHLIPIVSGRVVANSGKIGFFDRRIAYVRAVIENHAMESQAELKTCISKTRDNLGDKISPAVASVLSWVRAYLKSGDYSVLQKYFLTSN